jgi:hypothetical protein
MEMTARVYLPPELPSSLSASLYVVDDIEDRRYQGERVDLIPGHWHDLKFTIPPLNGVCLSEAGVVIRNLGKPATGPLYVDYLDWSGTPNFRIDFEKERNEQGAISQWTFLRGNWRVENGGFHGSGVGVSEAYTGDIDWQDYSLQVQLTPLVGESHHILVRVRGALTSYGFGLAPDNQLILYKNEQGYKPVAKVPFPWQHGATYRLSLAAQGNKLIALVQGGPTMEWTDEHNPYLAGQIGLSNFNGCHTRIEAVAITPFGGESRWM